MGNIVVYTAVTGDYDRVFMPVEQTEGVQYVLFTDTHPSANGWEVRPIEHFINDNNALTNRWYKLFPHKLFPNADITIYIDGNIRILRDLNSLIDEFVASNAAIGLFRHYQRQNILEEVDACRKLKKFSVTDEGLISTQLRAYDRANFIKEHKLLDNGIIFRNHKHTKLTQTMDLWWSHLNMYTKRDQISLPYIIWDLNVAVKVWNWSSRGPNNGYFLPYRHQKKQTITNFLVVCITANLENSKLARLVWKILITSRKILTFK